MLRNYLPFYGIARKLEYLLRRAMVLESNSSLEERDPDLTDFQALLGAMRQACEEHGLSHTAEMAKRAAERAERMPVSDVDIRHALLYLNDSLTSELEREAIFRIPPERTNYYEQDDLFGPEVAAAFPSCERDIREAGSCYALARADGCVHHLMLVLERGLNALAGDLGVP